MRLAVVLVHYHTPRLLAGAVEALAEDLRREGLEADWRVVDNGSDAAGRACLEGLGLPLLAPGSNRGFAAGVNRGVEATQAESILVLNPDVRVLPGCIRGLVEALERGADAAAPRLFWDHGKRFRLPPGEERTRRWELLALGARRSEVLAGAARRRWRRLARRHWEARRDLPSFWLSGAALAFSRQAWRRVGPFDEGFRLYFEETDWLLRLRAAGGTALQVAAAEAVHDFAQSTRREPRARDWFADSARRFGRSHYGALFTRLLEALAAAAAGERRSSLPLCDPEALRSVVARGECWIELSPNLAGFPAAGERLPASALPDWKPPFDLMQRSGLEEMTLCVSDTAGRELARLRVVGRARTHDYNRSLSPRHR